MTYHDLSECTLNAFERREESNKILKMLPVDKLTKSESKFYAQMFDRKEVSVKQLFWLRDIKDKYL